MLERSDPKQNPRTKAWVDKMYFIIEHSIKLLADFISQIETLPTKFLFISQRALFVSAQQKFYYATARLTNTNIERRFAKTLRVLAAPPFFVCIRDPSPYHSKILASPTPCFLTGKIKSYRLNTPRLRGGSPKEIHPNIKEFLLAKRALGSVRLGHTLDFMFLCRLIKNFDTMRRVFSAAASKNV